MAEFSDMIGLTIVKIEGCEKDSEKITFSMSDGSDFVLIHYQDCCEMVHVDDVVGDPMDLLYAPILLAEEVKYIDCNSKVGFYNEVEDWTFYKISTLWANVTIKWYSTSNGYYSTSVDCERRFHHDNE